MARTAPRVRAELSVTLRVVSSGASWTCRTRDVSHFGVFLATDDIPSPLSDVELSLLDAGSGEVIQLHGAVMRVVAGPVSGVGIQLGDPPPAWLAMVDGLLARGSGRTRAPSGNVRRMRVLVVAGSDAQRSALALYVQSGWDVRFATDLAGTEQALREGQLDAVIAESGAGHLSWTSVLEAARREQPEARRIVRTTEPVASWSSGGAPTGLVHRIVDAGAELDVLAAAIA